MGDGGFTWDICMQLRCQFLFLPSLWRPVLWEGRGAKRIVCGPRCSAGLRAESVRPRIILGLSCPVVRQQTALSCYQT